MKKQLITLAALAGGFVLGASALVALASDSTWSAPLHTPSTCLTGEPGCDAPINVGAAVQTKSGLLGLGNTVINSLRVLTAEGTTTSTQGQVLTAINNNGDVGWRAGGGGGSGMVFLNTPIMIGVGYGNTAWQTVSKSTLLADGVPSSAQAVILDLYGANASAGLRTSASAPYIISVTTGYWIGTHFNSLTVGAGNSSQVIQPLTPAGTFDWQSVMTTNAGVPWSGISLVGYVN